MARHPFEDIPDGQLESLNALQAQYRQDNHEAKVDLMVGVYQTDQGRPFVLPSVKMAREKLFANPDWNHDYPSSHLGTEGFRRQSTALFFGEDDPLQERGCIPSMQCLGASGACHMGALFLSQHYEPFKRGQARKVYIPAETWANHPNVFQSVGLQTETLPWYNRATGSLDSAALLAAIQRLPAQSVVVLQTVGNNPTGCDPSPDEWAQLTQALAAGHHFAFLDVAYPGFVSGCFAQDCAPIRRLAAAGVPLMVAASFGKAFGLYGERVGLLAVPVPGEDLARRVERQMKRLARAETGAQPAFGAAIVETILTDGRLRAVWEDDLRGMAEQMRERRERLCGELERLRSPHDWRFVVEQVGMFCYTGLTTDQIDRLREDHHVYLQDTGRISIAGLNSSNIVTVAAAMDAVVRGSEGKKEGVE